ncbi:hypothetical protein OHB39_33980 [Streptomyces sp. NBC_00047]|uniref:hypothetical protein n=1 Tax=Streptomyces sp. NBC_00047 TaxID=2975627 RepID=UPI00224F26D2|nr:hypothetical protein [Streptomyces sp. NBC_00047]MCX5612535.1 hypothetical protein [Streptomyces sp. NBC_00047]
MTVKRLTAPGFGPLAVLGVVRVTECAPSAYGRELVELSWSARVWGTADSGAGVVRHGLVYSGLGEGCRCARRACGGIVPEVWCEEHGARAQ